MNGILQVDDTRPSLVVHIGGGKSGSTAIQDLLFANRGKLGKMGYAIPDTDLKNGPGEANQIWFFQNLVENPDRTTIVARHLDELCRSFSECCAAPFRGIILSAENLTHDSGLEQIFAALKDRFRVSIILYIRRQEDFYHSAWQQWFVKMHPAVDTWLLTWLQEWDADTCDWDRMIERWEAITPDSFSVRIFDRDLLTGGDVVDDFCSVLGLDIDELRRPNGDTNVSYGAHISDLYRSMASIFDGVHDHRVEAEFHRLGVGAVRKRRGEWLFTREQLDFIRERHAAGNARIKARYFADMPGDALFAPVPETDICGPSQIEMNWRNLGVLGELSIRQNREVETKIAAIEDRLEAIDRKVNLEIASLQERLAKLETQR